MTQNIGYTPDGAVKIHVTTQTSTPGNGVTYQITTEPRPNIIQRAIGAIGALFEKQLPDQGGKSDVTDTALVIKTSPTIWEYEMFKQEWDRRSLLREIDMILKTDPRAKRANRAFAQSAVRNGITVTVTSEVSDALAEQAQDVIDGVVSACQINSKLASWCRIILKDGDLMLNLVIDVNKMEIRNIKRLPAISMQRNEDMMGNFQDLNEAFQQIDPISLQIIEHFPLWGLNHIRWDHEEGDRYGNSQYLQVRGYWKKLNMTEEDLVVRRRTRAVPRRFHSVGNKDNPGGWDEVEVYKAKNQMNVRSPQIVTDYFGNGLTDVKDLGGDADLDHIKDIEHLQEVYALGLGVPLHLFGFGKIGAGADIIEKQEKQFKEDTQELRDLIEYGDSSPYSGLRVIFDFALAMKGIDPNLVDYNISWYADNNETAKDRVERVLALRSAEPGPLVSRKTAIQILAKDLNLENDSAIESEIEQIDEEEEHDRESQAMLMEGVNPENPSTRPMSQHAVAKAFKDAVELAVASGERHKIVGAQRRAGRHAARVERQFEAQDRETSKKKEHWPARNGVCCDSHAQAFADLTQGGAFEAMTDAKHKNPLRGRDVGKYETKVARMVRRHFKAMLDAMHVDDLARAADKHASLPSHRDTLVSDVLDAFVSAAKAQRDARVADFFAIYRDMAGLARKEASSGKAHLAVMTDDIEESTSFTNQETADYFMNEAGTRITGIDATTLNTLRGELEAAYSRDEPWGSWVQRIQNVLECPEWRADMIARTELSWAYNSGLIATYRELGIDLVMWLAVIDNMTCERCASRHEQVFRVAEVEGQIPLHPRCRCTLVSA